MSLELRATDVEGMCIANNALEKLLLVVDIPPFWVHMLKAD